MASVKSFEELQVWQKARMVCQMIYTVSSTNSFSKDFSMKDQINRAAGSVMDNIAEGFERGGRKEFIQFLSVAKGSAGEVRSQLYRSLDRNHITQDDFNKLSELILEVGRMITGLMSYLAKTPIKGTKYIEKPEILYQTLTTNSAEALEDQDNRKYLI